MTYSYDPIIASGRNANTLHYTKNNSLIHKNRFLLIDMGVRYQKYNADITRTVVEKPSKRQIKIYDAVIAIQEYAFKNLRPGISLIDYEKLMQKFIGEKLRELGLIQSISSETVREFFPHAMSHFVGVDVHDVGDREKELMPGMILTVEPGIYIRDEELGIRLEDMILITDKGNKILSSKIDKKIDKLN